jgi:chorismate mutase
MTGRPHPPRDVEFHLTMSEQDRELLDTLAHRMEVSRTATISRALHLLKAVQDQARTPHEQQDRP